MGTYERDAPSPDRRVLGVILAGGLSRRMGVDKAALVLAGADSGRRCLLEWTAHRLRPVCTEILVSSRSPNAGAPIGAPTILDETERLGPAGGILSALRYLSAHGKTETAVFVCGCDMPLICGELVRHMVSLLASVRLSGHGAVACLTDRGVEPLHAVWSPEALPAVEAELAGGVRAVHRILESDRIGARMLEPHEWRAFDPEGRSFFNINTPEDLAQAEAWLGS